MANDTRKPQHQLLLGTTLQYIFNIMTLTSLHVEFKSILNELLREAETTVERRPSADIQLENRDDVIIQSRASKFFCGEQRASSPFGKECMYAHVCIIHVCMSVCTIHVCTCLQYLFLISDRIYWLAVLKCKNALLFRNGKLH